MRKQVLYSIMSILLLTIAVIGSTYAYFSASASSNENVEGTSKTFDVIYTGGTTISGPINLGSKKEDGLNTTVNIKMAEGSALATATLYINIEKITSNLATEGFVWEVIGTKNNTQVYYNKGNFVGTNNTTKNIVNIVENYKLSEENTSFTVYLWIDGNKVDNNIVNAEFQGYIGAKTENFTGATVQ